LAFASLRHSAGRTAHKHKRQMLTKRIERTLTIEIARNTRHTYEKELLNSRKKVISTKRIIPASLLLSPMQLP
jgi:hypothetical protein